ncbi:rho GTPase-activating protein 6-like [Arapaima gigas]
MGAGRGQAIGRVEAPRPAHLDLGCVQSARARAGRWRRRSPCSARCQTEHHRAAMLAHGIRLRPVPIQSLSELERARLREVASWHLEEKDLECKISIPRGKSPPWVRRRDATPKDLFVCFTPVS